MTVDRKRKRIAELNNIKLKLKILIKWNLIWVK